MSSIARRPISHETNVKVIRTAIDILRMHGSIAGNRICQDWSGGDQNKPSNTFDDKERDDLKYNHEIRNSRLEDYDPGYDGFHDEMAVSFTMADALADFLEEFER